MSRYRFWWEFPNITLEHEANLPKWMDEEPNEVLYQVRNHIHIALEDSNFQGFPYLKDFGWERLLDGN